MKEYPFKTPQMELHYLNEPYWDMLRTIRSQVYKRLAHRSKPHDGRHGFGTVSATGRLLRSGRPLQVWKWRYTDPADYPSWIEARQFVDDPIGVVATASMATRLIVAEEFVDVARTMFDPEDVTFNPRAIEVVAAGPERPPGIQRGEDTDLLAIELYDGVPMPKIIDQLVQIEFDLAEERQTLISADYWLQIQLWHRAERVHAARALLGLDLPAIKVPGIAALRKRVDPMMDAKIEKERGKMERIEAAALLRER